MARGIRQDSRAIWQPLVEFCRRLCDRYQEVDGFLVRYDALTNPDFDAKPIERYLGFALDLAARTISAGASPPGQVAADEMNRLQKVVDPLAAQLGYVDPVESS